MVSHRRNGIYRSVFVALVGVVLLGAAPAPDKGAHTEQTRFSQSVERSLEVIAAGGNNSVTAKEGGDYQKPCNDGQPNYQSDLCAQWWAANAAREAADWAYWSLVVGGVGAVGIIVALLLTIDSNRIARTSAHRQLRAYVGIESIEFVPNWQPDPPYVTGMAGGRHIRVVIRNFGATPANGVTTRFHPCLQTKSELAADPTIFDLEPEMQLTLQPGQPHTKIIDVDHRPSDSEETLLRSENFLMTVQGVITYLDAWDKPHKTQFFWTSSGEDYSNGRFRAHHWWNDAT